jgi:hypothetical protein
VSFAVCPIICPYNSKNVNSSVMFWTKEVLFVVSKVAGIPGQVVVSHVSLVFIHELEYLESTITFEIAYCGVPT